MKHLKIILILANLLLITSQLILTQFRATDGSELASLETELAVVSASNRQLESQILAASSLNYIFQASQESGFRSISITSLAPLPVAQAQP